MSNVVELRPKDKRISDAELQGLMIGARLNAAILPDAMKQVWESLVLALMELEERRSAEKWEKRNV